LNENPAKYHRMVDLMLSTLRSKSYAELAYGDGIERLKEELLAKLRPFVSRGKILRVLFHELYFAELLPYARVGS
jgi:flagellar basal body-associated protein FliL